MTVEPLDKLIHEVRHCEHCKGRGLPFVPANGEGWPAFRFPPTIGAMGPAPLLFVGINPRVSESNLNLHKALMSDFDVFVQLAGNRFRGDRYVSPNGLERHYLPHMQIAHKIYPHRHFEEVAAVTELFFCASESANGLPIEQSPCAARYFEQVLSIIQPSVVFAVGRRVEDYLTQRFGRKDGVTFATWGDEGQPMVIGMPHPNAYGEKLSGWAKAAECARSYLLSSKQPRREREPNPIETKPSNLDAVGSRHVGTVTRLAGKTLSRVSYQSTRLHFKRSHIAPLNMEDTFEIVTPGASWCMTKADFYRVFQNVIHSQSYSGPRGEYFYPKPPKQAEPFRVR